MIGFVHTSIQDTIKALMLDGLSKEEAIAHIESIFRTKIPDEIKERLCLTNS